jgi:hypothetical protein
VSDRWVAIPTAFFGRRRDIERHDRVGERVKRLEGKKVWVIQFDDEDNSVIGIVEGVDSGFIALRMEHETSPTLYVNLANVKEIEVFRERGDGELRLLRFPNDADPGATEPRP